MIEKIERCPDRGFRILQRWLKQFRLMGRVVSLGAAGVLLAGLGAAGAQEDSVQAAPESVEEALQTMRAIEEAMSEAQQQIEAQTEALEDATETLESSEMRLRRQTRDGSESEQFYEAYRERSERELEGVAEQAAADRAYLRAMDERMRRLWGALVYESSRGHARESIALALIEQHYRERAAVATARLLRMEGQREEILAEREQAKSAVRRHTVFTEARLRQLQERHRTLVGEMKDLQAEIEMEKGRVASLEQRQQEIQALMSDLIEKESAREAEAARTAEETRRAEATATPGPAPAVAVSKAELAGVPYEAGSEWMTGEQQAGELRASAEEQAGPRHLFWWATPVSIHALAGGEVVFSGNFAGYRHLLILDHGGNWRSLYGNLTESAIRVGEQVSAGQRLGVYQAGQGNRAEPFWVEVRRGVEPVALESWPALPPDWEQRMFGQ